MILPFFAVILFYPPNSKPLFHNGLHPSTKNINRYWLIWIYTIFGYYVKWKKVGGIISYDNLWNVMKERGVTQYALIKTYHISPAQITRLKRNESVSTHTIEMFCKILNCEVEDIMKYIPDEE